MASTRPVQPIREVRNKLGPVHFRRPTSLPPLSPVENKAEGEPLPHDFGRSSVVAINPTRRRPQTAGQRRAADEARQVAAAWASLTDPQRATWAEYADQLQLTQEPDSTGKWSGWAAFSAAWRRWALAGMTGPAVPTWFSPLRVDRPWRKCWIEADRTTLHHFSEPRTDPPPIDPTLGVLYLSPPRPGTRRSIGHREKFLTTFDGSQVNTPAGAIATTIPGGVPVPPGSVLDYKAVLTDSWGSTSNILLDTVQAPPAGMDIAFILWGWNSFVLDTGWEITADYLLRCWNFDYPTGSSAELDIGPGSGRDVRDVRTFLFNNTGGDVYTVNGSLLSRPATDLSPAPRQRVAHNKNCVPFFARL